MGIGTRIAAAALAAPFLPLYLIEFSVSDLLKRVLGALV